MKTAKFKQLRFLEWVKTNPVPINSKLNYLTNSREIALSGVKRSKPTFNSKYDNGIYKYPIYHGKDRFHPTQKSLPLFEELVQKHSSEGALVLDCFAGSATTALAARNTGRNFIGCEMNEEYYNKSKERLNG
jgi:site-specific DNA-methyltransferase (adenine-specific)